MVSISNNGFVKMSRGDSFSIPLFIDVGILGAPVRYYISKHPNTSIYLGVMEPNQPFEDAVIRKKYTYKSKQNENGDIIISFYPQDTEYLLPGKYFYSLKMQTGNCVETIIPRTEFYISE